MKSWNAHWVAPVVAGLALAVAGCASPPETEKKAADAAVAAARSAEADRYAAPAYRAVTDLQKQAEAQMADKKYKEAKASYERLKGLADDAAKAAASGKAALKAEVEKGIVAVEAGWAELEKQAKRAARKLKADQKKAWEEDTKAVREALKAAKDFAANAPAQAKEKLVAATATMEKWSKDLAALAAPPPAAKKPAKKS
jgi:hypothetical protein